MSSIGVVTIGRNEGERLERCLDSLLREGRPVVYVDSGSTDGSVAYARQVGAEVVELDMSVPFTAARARNAGFQRLMERYGDLNFVQFVDGDCEMFPGWFDAAQAALAERDDVAVVSGRLWERHPEQTIYNRLCDLEWKTAPGESRSCGGNFMIRTRAFRESGRFNESLIAGEEPELCVRLRDRGEKILRLSDDMAWHDAATTHFSQWWKRTVRGGYAAMEGHVLHSDNPNGYAARQVRSNWFWGLAVPAAVLLTIWPTGGWSLLVLLGYPLMVLRIARQRMTDMGDPFGHAVLFGLFTMLGKFAAVTGQIKYWANRLRGRQATIIEYKAAG